ncbi:MAG: CCE_0567 family metalloprotein [Sulfurimonadaceae bacterium]
MSDEKDLKKELAKRKRIAMEIASAIHDIVEDTIWVDYVKLPALSGELVAAVEEAHAFAKEHNL